MQQGNDYIRSFYDEKIPKDFSYGYEFDRWFKTARLRLDYTMMYKVIAHHISSIKYTSVFELGPGPGTWTRVLYRNNPDAQFTLVDISKEMQKQFALEMRTMPNVEYLLSDINEFPGNKQFELVFSSRAIEYIADPKKAFTKLSSLTAKGGSLVMVTKNPRHFRTRRASVRHEHTMQIPVEQMRDLLTEVGFSEVQCYPCIIRLPLVDRLGPYLSENIFKKNYTKPIDGKLTKLAESYVVTAKK